MPKLLDSSESGENIDDWHETDLVQAYKQSINIGKSKESNSLESNKLDFEHKSKIELFENHEHYTNTSNAKVKASENVADSEKLTSFVIGTPCRAIYDEDNVEYEGTIIGNVDDEHVLVEFFGYGNTQKVKKSDLKKSHDLQARMKQYYESAEYNTHNNDDKEIENDLSPKHSKNVPKSSKHPAATSLPNFNECAFPPPPPFPPKIAMNMNYEEYESLNAMLMATYMKGFYTGYYQYLKSKK